MCTQTKWQGLIPVSTEAAPDLFAAQHTYTAACDGFHAPGPCPQPEHRHHFVMVAGGMACACGERIP